MAAAIRAPVGACREAFRVRALRCRAERHGWSRELAVVHPLAPVLLRPPHPVGGVLVRRRRLVVGPRERDEPLVALADGARRVSAVALERPSGGPSVSWNAGRAPPSLRATASLLPSPSYSRGPAPAAVVGHRVAVHQDLDVAVHAPDRAEQDVLGLVVAGRTVVLDGPLRVVVPRGRRACPGRRSSRSSLPRGLEHEGPRHVAAADRDMEVGRSEAEEPASRSSIAPNTDGLSGRGRQSYSTFSRSARRGPGPAGPRGTRSRRSAGTGCSRRTASGARRSSCGCSARSPGSGRVTRRNFERRLGRLPDPRDRAPTPRSPA